jgi:hypothetical protein
MAKKKPAKSKKPVAGSKMGRKSARNAGRKAVKKNPRKGARVVARKKKPLAAAPQPVEERPSLGRPKVTGEEDLDLFFKEDYHARQIFKFLGVQTVKELERYSSSEILRRLSIPIKETVERVRRLLAQYNRCLHGDESFAMEHKAPVSP